MFLKIPSVSPHKNLILVLNNFLSYNAREWFANHEQIFYIIFVVLWVTGIAGGIISPLINGAYSGLSYLGMKAFGLLGG